MVRFGPLNEPVRAISKWRHLSEPVFSSHVADAFDSLNIRYTTLSVFSAPVDLTSAIATNFSTHEDRCLLSFLLSSPVESHSSDALQNCIDYFKSISKGSPDKHVVENHIDYYVAHGPFAISN